jgi:hypothetical protein
VGEDHILNVVAKEWIEEKQQRCVEAPPFITG